MALISCGGGVYAVYQVAFKAALLSMLFWLGFWLPIGYMFFH
ncbi:hypothetical protein VDQ74_17780 [Xanthomonas campestris pv. campestris]|nr:hypothetical protein [Xanthomonas campestris pv. campestris]